MVRQLNIMKSKFSILDCYEWLLESATALIIVSYIYFMSYAFMKLDVGINYQTWQSFLQGRWMAYTSLLFLFSVCWQSWIGMEELTWRYFSANLARNIVLTLVGAALIFYFAWGVAILWGF
jgi:succinate dehydrogenase hydrophobic membrane anchor protein